MKRRTLDYETPKPPRFRLDTRALLIAIVIVLLVRVVVYHAQERWLAVMMVLLSDGLMVAGWIGSAWAIGHVLAGFAVGRAGQAQRLKGVTTIAVGLGVVGLAALGLGLIGALNRWTALAILLIGPVIVAPRIIAKLKHANEIRIDSWLFAPAGWHWLWLLAVPFVATMITGASILPGVLWKPDDPHPYDAMEYHLHIPREWYELGRIVPLKHNVFSFFPFGTEMHYLLAMHIRGGAWKAMYQCQCFSVAWAILTALAVYGTARRWTADALLPCIAAVLVLATPWTVMLGSVAYQEGLLGLYACLTMAWVIEALRGESPARAMLLAGALAGLACGVKYTAVPMVLGATGLAAIVGAIVTRRLLIKPLLIYGVAALVVASPWLVRNMVWAKGNPVFPLAMRTLGRGHFDEKQVERFEAAHSPTAGQKTVGGKVVRMATAIFGDWQYGYVMWGVVIAAMVQALTPTLSQSTGRRSGVMIGVYLLIVLLIWIFFTHLLGRFFYLTVPVAAPAVSLPAQKWWRWSALAGVAILAAVSLALLDAKFDRFRKLASQGLYALDDLSFLTPAELEKMDTSGETVTLVGDAQAFLYQIPAKRLRYHTVFDLPSDASDAWQAWLSVPLGQAKGLIVVHPAEIDRLSKTYRHVPPLPLELRDKGSDPFVLRK